MDHSPPSPMVLNSPPSPMVLNSPPSPMVLNSPPPPPVHGHYALHNRIEFGGELWKWSKGPIDAFEDKLVEYGCSRVEDSEHVGRTGPSTEKGCCDILNSLIPKSTQLVEFFVTGSKAPKGHGTGTLCRPDLAARLSSTAVPSTAAAAWVDLEAVVAVHSLGESIEGNTKQAVAYTAYLLAARPDRVAMLGLYISKQDYTVILADPTGIYYSHRIPWKDISLLRSALHCINDPPLCMIDPTIKREAMGTFTITMAPKVYHGCRQQWSPTLGRWTVVFTTSPGETVPVIKEQYLRCNVEITEGNILKHVHSLGDIPGVVRLGEYGPVTREDGSPVECGPMNNRRRKVRLELKDRGESFMMVETPYDALVAIWDLLEVSRCLYREREVLHRDISKGNVLVRMVGEGGKMSASDETGTQPEFGFRSVRHLLRRSHPPNNTWTLLIDFDHADHIKNIQGGPPKRQNVGTPVFMARAVVVGHPLASEKYFGLCALPMLSDEAHKVYQDLCPERLERFPQPSVHQNDILCVLDAYAEVDEETVPCVHELRHDAESAFWLLVWWAVHIRSPVNQNSDPSKIPYSVWMHLTSADPQHKKDDRPCFLQGISRPSSLAWLDPAYIKLAPLFKQMAKQIEKDVYWVNRVTSHPRYMLDPEFHHEALQRLILNFLTEHGDEAFLNLKRHSQHRKTEPQRQNADLSGSDPTRFPVSFNNSRESVTS